MNSTEPDTPPSGQATGGWMEYMSKTATAYLPTQMTEMLAQDRAFATCRLPVAVHLAEKHHTQLALTKYVPPMCTRAWFDICSVRNNQVRLLAATTDGYVYIYAVDIRSGGECALVKQHRFTSTVAPAPLAHTPGNGQYRQLDGQLPLLRYWG
jgi:autophagy-related protein 18